MSRPTWDELAKLRSPIGVHGVPKGLDSIRIWSGSIPRDEDALEFEGELHGTVLLGPIQRGPGWIWTEYAVFAGLTKDALLKFAGCPCWDGIRAGDVVTKGHVAALVQLNLLKGIDDLENNDLRSRNTRRRRFGRPAK